jgi:hypothetical protein
MTDLLLRWGSESRAGAEGQDDYDVIGADGLVIERIFKASTSPPGTPWMWSLGTPTHGYEPRGPRASGRHWRQAPGLFRLSRRPLTMLSWPRDSDGSGMSQGPRPFWPSTNRSSAVRPSFRRHPFGQCLRVT